MSQKAKNPGLALRVRYISQAGTSVVKVVPDGGNVSIGNETWKVPPGALYTDKSRPTVDCVQGRAVAEIKWGERDPLTPEEYDATAHNNLLEQIHTISKGGKTSAISWVQVGLSAVLVLAIVGVGFKLNGDFEDVHSAIKRSHPAMDDGAIRDAGGVSVTRPSDPQPGSLGDLQEGEGS